MAKREKIKTIGMTLSDLERDEINHLFSRTLSLVPSDGDMNAVLEKSAGKLIGHLKVNSHAGVFEAKSEGTSAVELMKNLTSTIVKQLKEWKIDRF